MTDKLHTGAGSTFAVGEPFPSARYPRVDGGFLDVALISTISFSGVQSVTEEYVDPDTLFVTRHKTSIDRGTISLSAAVIGSSLAQLRLHRAASSEDTFSCRLTFGEQQTAIYFTGLVTKAAFGPLSLDAVRTVAFDIAINSNLVEQAWGRQ